MSAGKDSVALAQLFTRSYKPARPFPRFVSSSEGGGGGRPWEDESLRPLLVARKPSAARDGKDRLSTLPLDVLLLIFESASPGALLALARTTKAFRRLLLARSPKTEALWAHARRTVGWPDLSEPLGEPRYAHLIEGEVLPGGASYLGYDPPIDAYYVPEVVGHETQLASMACSQAFSYVQSCRENVLAARWDAGALEGVQRGIHDDYWKERRRMARLSLDRELAAMGFMPEDYADIPHTAWWRDDWWHPLPNPPDREHASVDSASNTDSEFEEEWDDVRFQHEWNSSLLADFFERPGEDTVELDCSPDWDDVKPFIVEYADCCRRVRLRREQGIHRDDQKEQIRPLYDQVRALLDSSRRRIFPNLVDFAFLPSVVPLWFPDNVVVTPSSWPALYPSILVDVLREIRTLKIRLFDRIARTLPSLPPHLRLTLSSELVDRDAARAPLHALLSDSDMDPLFARATALFRCGVCARKLVYPRLVEHLRDEHRAGSAQCAAWACMPREGFRMAVREMLAAAGLEEETSDEALEGLGRVFEVWERGVDGGVVETRESWDEVTSGKCAEQLKALTHKLSFSPDRDIVNIRLCGEGGEGKGEGETFEM